MLMIFRVAGHYLLALILYLTPVAGAHHQLAAAILAFIAAPAGLLLSIRFKFSESAWRDTFFDLATLLLLIHLLPDYWHPALLVGVILSLSPSFNTELRSHRFFTAAAVMLMVGMSLAAFVHDVPGWILPMLVLAAIYPGVIYYAHWQANRADKLRFEAQKLQSLRMVSGSIAHDFNNILTTVIGNTELALTHIEPQHKAAQQLRDILASANRAGMLSRQMLAFAGRRSQDNEYSEFRLADEVDAAIVYLQGFLPAGLEIKVEVEAGLPDCYGSSSEIRQAIVNLLLNAAEAAGNTSPIQVRLYGNTDPTQPGLGIEISDQGDGITAPNLPRIFDPFFSSKVRGHGLGLATVERIVNDHNGSITISSQPGLGTVARINLHTSLIAAPLSSPGVNKPATTEPVLIDVATTAPTVTDTQQQEPKVAGARPTPKTAILIVDDEPSIREMMKEVISVKGFTPLLASNGLEGLTLFELHQADIEAVLLDLQMPVMNGWECLAGIRALAPPVPVLIISGYDPDHTLRELHDPHLAFLTKPFRLAELNEALAALAPLQATPSSDARPQIN